MFKFRELFAAGAFVQRTGTSPSSFTGVNVASAFAGNSTIRGIATVLSGTVVASVTATGAVSGDIIVAGIYNYTGDFGSASYHVAVHSVGANYFQIQMVGSIAPTTNLPVAWFRVA